MLHTLREGLLDICQYGNRWIRTTMERNRAKALAGAKVEYVDGYLQDKSVNALNYGYNKNHLPETTKKPREIKSSLDNR